ncbi:MAG TPA: glutamate mutase L [Anaerolineaceae bacterium]|nr:glutamate mutase L [Anaerolineaceae bacterium]HPN51763.1 glutamate mutase L [Anaerolineaceae bacterium]
MTSLIDSESLLAIDVGSINTRAFLFDVSEGTYHFLSMGSAPTTITGAFNDIYEGVHAALERLQEISGRTLLNDQGQVMGPSLTDGSGVDTVVSTYSVGPVINTVVVALLSDVSMESAYRLASSSYAAVVETIGLTDRRKVENQIDAILKARPDLVIVAGGTENGASKSVLKLLDVVGTACALLPVDARPQVLYGGNQALVEEVKTKLDVHSRLHICPNIRPKFNQENINGSQQAFNEAIFDIRNQQLGHLERLSMMGGGHLTPSAQAFGRLIRFLSQVYNPGKGVLGLDVGGGHTVLAAATGGRLSLNVCAGLGVGEGLTSLMMQTQLTDILPWLPIHISPEYVQDYLFNKLSNPALVPATLEDLSIEQAVTRQVIRMAVRQTAQRYPAVASTLAAGASNQFEPVLASGAALTQAPTPGQALLMLLDGLQPVGTTTFVLDQNNLANALGAAAAVNSILPVQVIDTGVFLNLGTVISPISSAKYGSTILHARVELENGSENRVEVKQGSLMVLPVPNGQRARIHLDPLAHTDVGMNRSGRGGAVNVVGGVLGVVIDARGRPLVLPPDDARRQDMIKKWLWRLGG